MVKRSSHFEKVSFKNIRNQYELSIQNGFVLFFLGGREGGVRVKNLITKKVVYSGRWKYQNI